jgi:DNA-binding XRE family transcriptional regulator
MLARTRMHHTENNTTTIHSPHKKKREWRTLFERELDSHSEQGLYLKGLRLREGYTQAQLGELVGVSQNNISAMEHGKRSIGKEIALRLAQVFKVNYQFFL